ncbi:MAG: lytic transglycosylase domain-containing protein [Acidobacteria bacterium]|nr:lytic transglycosylase domain-containing protein [Acidobacteriota bacterium]
MESIPPAAAYQAAAKNYPNFYYGILSRKRLAEPALARATGAPGVEEFVAGIDFPRPDFGGFHATAATQARIERSRQLYTAGLNELAEAEMRFGAKTDSQGHLLAMELAQRSVREGDPAQGLRWIKALAPNYLRVPLSAAPDSFWMLAFPLPFKNELARHSRAQELDPYIVAALVRQESEFNPTAVSRSNAYGLTQVLPSTGRSISRRAGIRKFRTSMLFSPDINLKLGTFYFRMLLDGLEGQWESALASYNAGKSRVVAWKTWFDFREPAEFVETIPFTETRNYVQVVMRNADVYRRLYGENAHAALKAAPDLRVVIQKASYSSHHGVKAKAKGKAKVKRGRSRKASIAARKKKKRSAGVRRS